MLWPETKPNCRSCDKLFRSFQLARWAGILGFLQSAVSGMVNIALVLLALKTFQNAHPDLAIPTESLPVLQSDPIRLELFLGRIVIQPDVPGEPDILTRGAKREIGTGKPP